MKESIRQESRTFGTLADEAAEYAARKGAISEKKLSRALGIFRPTAAKLLAAFVVAGAAREIGRGKFAFLPAAYRPTDGGAEGYLPLAETDAAFSEVGVRGYLKGTLLPALKIGLTYGSLSVIFLERKMSVGYERAHEVYDIIAVAGLLGEEDGRNPGRRLLTLSPARYDELYAEVNAE